MLLEVLDEDLLQSVRHALNEDIGSGDVTASLIPAGQTAEAEVICREPAILCGMAWFNAVFSELNTDVKTDWLTKDGDHIQQDQVLCKLHGPTAAMLTGERTALNFLQTLSGTATLARQYADAVDGLPVRILDTRKTLPGLRRAQKYAVRMGGCQNHRHGLFDGILIKENHIRAAGSIHQAVTTVRTLNSDLPVEVEVENLDELQAAIDAGADSLLLDNFSVDALRAAVDMAEGQVKLEASGNISLENLLEIATIGVDFISIGTLTKNIHAIDLTMIFK
jgi:nicotinate-nucleotide pyrophosphorylase (carboxylating)